MLSLSVAAGTNNTQGEMINTHRLYSISQHHYYHRAHTHARMKWGTHAHVQYTDVNVKQRASH